MLHGYDVLYKVVLCVVVKNDDGIISKDEFQLWMADKQRIMAKHNEEKTALISVSCFCCFNCCLACYRKLCRKTACFGKR